MTTTTTDQARRLDHAVDDRPAVVRARAAIGGRDAVLAAMIVVTEEITAARRAVAPVDEAVTTDVLAAVLDGRRVPDDVGQRITAGHAANAAAIARAGALDRVSDRLTHELRRLDVEGADAALAVLRADLDAVLHDAAPVVETLADVHDPGAAIRGGLAGEWRTFEALAERLASLRHAQAIIVSAAVDPPDRPTGTTSRVTPHVRRLVDDHGHLAAAAEHGSIGLSDHDRREAEVSTRPLPHARGWIDGDPLDRLRWCLLTPGVEPWLPTIDELHEAAAAHADEQLRRGREEHGLSNAGGTMVGRSPITVVSTPAGRVREGRSS